jgi:hypothetical protein
MKGNVRAMIQSQHSKASFTTILQSTCSLSSLELLVFSLWLQSDSSSSSLTSLCPYIVLSRIYSLPRGIAWKYKRVLIPNTDCSHAVLIRLECDLASRSHTSRTPPLLLAGYISEYCSHVRNSYHPIISTDFEIPYYDLESKEIVCQPSGVTVAGATVVQKLCKLSGVRTLESLSTKYRKYVSL